MREDQLSQAIGRHGQNVRLASKLCGWDIEIMTADELEEQIQRAVASYMELEGMTEELASRLVEQGYLSYDDLSVIEPDMLMEMGELSAEQVDALVNQAEERALVAEEAANEQKRLRREAIERGEVPPPLSKSEKKPVVSESKPADSDGGDQSGSEAAS